MEVLATTVVVERRKKVQKNIFLPEPVTEAVDEVVAEFGRQKGWAVYGAAMVMLLRAPPKERGRLVAEMVGADTSGEVEELVRSALAEASRAEAGGPRYAELVSVREGLKRRSGQGEAADATPKSRSAKRG